MSSRAKILVVDDNDVCRACQNVLAEDGCDVHVARTGEEARRRIRHDEFDIALINLKIPGSGGLNLVRAIRKASPRMGVVVITESPSIENAKESIRLGAFDFVTEPLVPERVRSVIAQALTCKPWTMAERC